AARGDLAPRPRPHAPVKTLDRVGDGGRGRRSGWRTPFGVMSLQQPDSARVLHGVSSLAASSAALRASRSSRSVALNTRSSNATAAAFCVAGVPTEDFRLCFSVRTAGLPADVRKVVMSSSTLPRAAL